MRRKLDSHKGDFGHVFVLAGSKGLTGAAYLASQACMLSGSGLVTLGIPESLNAIMEVKLTEVMTVPLAETKEASLSLKAWPQIGKFSADTDALAVGPGLSRNPQTMSLVRKVLSGVNKPLVLDADGINAAAGKLKALAGFKGDIVVTPHPGEMSNLLRLKASQIQKNRVKLVR
jgi:NAD(P)H-hydrate epimerase